MVDVVEIEWVVRSLRERILLAERADHSQDASANIVSAALGEAAEWREREVPALPVGLTFAKLGLAGLERGRAGLDIWRSVRERFDARAASPIGWIAVVYADWQAAETPSPEAILAEAGDCAGVLFDTFHKDGRTLFDWLSEAELRRFVESLRAQEVPVALAGSLRREHLPAVARLAPDIVAIRSAACAGGDRRGMICRDAVRAFRLEMQPCSS